MYDRPPVEGSVNVTDSGVALTRAEEFSNTLATKQAERSFSGEPSLGYKLFIGTLCKILSLFWMVPAGVFGNVVVTGTPRTAKSVTVGLYFSSPVALSGGNCCCFLLFPN